MKKEYKQIKDGTTLESFLRNWLIEAKRARVEHLASFGLSADVMEIERRELRTIENNNGGEITGLDEIGDVPIISIEGKEGREKKKYYIIRSVGFNLFWFPSAKYGPYIKKEDTRIHKK